MGWLGRKHGLKANALTAVELVTADGDCAASTTTTRPTCSFSGISGSGGIWTIVNDLPRMIRRRISGTRPTGRS